jgi:hypothetical protein
MLASRQLGGNRTDKRWVTSPNLHGLWLDHINLSCLRTGATSKDLVVVIAVGWQGSLRLHTSWILA